MNTTVWMKRRCERTWEINSFGWFSNSGSTHPLMNTFGVAQIPPIGVNDAHILNKVTHHQNHNSTSQPQHHRLPISHQLPQHVIHTRVEYRNYVYLFYSTHSFSNQAAPPATDWAIVNGTQYAEGTRFAYHTLKPFSSLLDQPFQLAYVKDLKGRQLLMALSFPRNEKQRWISESTWWLRDYNHKGPNTTHLVRQQTANMISQQNPKLCLEKQNTNKTYDSQRIRQHVTTITSSNLPIPTGWYQMAPHATNQWTWDGKYLVAGRRVVCSRRRQPLYPPRRLIQTLFVAVPPSQTPPPVIRRD